MHHILIANSCLIVAFQGTLEKIMRLNPASKEKNAMTDQLGTHVL